MISLWPIVDRLDRLGFRRAVAALATAVRFLSGSKQSFSVDDRGRWIHRHAEATIVSTTIHSASYEAYRGWVADNWLWQHCLCEGEVVIDVGAGVGEEAIVFSRMVGLGGRVLSIEAHPTTFDCLRQTVARSHLANVTAVQCAISDSVGAVVIDDTDSHVANSIVVRGGAGGHEVPSLTLDALAEQEGIDRVDLLKMNIEGAERMAVLGMAGLARRTRYIVISCHDFISDGGGSEELRTFAVVRAALQELGFECTYRPDASKPWQRYYIYGRNTAFEEAAALDSDKLKEP